MHENSTFHCLAEKPGNSLIIIRVGKVREGKGREGKENLD
jgi:hypothetical protein